MLRPQDKSYTLGLQLQVTNEALSEIQGMCFRSCSDTLLHAVMDIKALW